MGWTGNTGGPSSPQSVYRGVWSQLAVDEVTLIHHGEQMCNPTARPWARWGSTVLLLLLSVSIRSKSSLRTATGLTPRKIKFHLHTHLWTGLHPDYRVAVVQPLSLLSLHSGSLCTSALCRSLTYPESFHLPFHFSRHRVPPSSLH